MEILQQNWLPYLEFHISSQNLREIFRELCMHARTEFHACIHILSTHIISAQPTIVPQSCKVSQAAQARPRNPLGYLHCKSRVPLPHCQEV